MSKFLVHVTTAWCGMDQDYAAIANSEDELQDVAELAAYDNFADFDCLQQIMDDEGIDENAAAEVEHEYYGFYIDEWDEERPEEEWGWYELRWDFTNKSEDAEV